MLIYLDILCYSMIIKTGKLQEKKLRFISSSSVNPNMSKYQNSDEIIIIILNIPYYNIPYYNTKYTIIYALF